MSKYYMSREFKRCTGKTLFDFITDARIDTAKKLLRYTDLPVSIITDYAGFMDQSNFSRLFRLIEGVSPVAYRKQWNGI
jgi:AraC-like DNA-binding protein